MGLRIDWDINKAKKNLRKHAVSFEEAQTVFADPLSVTVDDPDHSEHEDRLLILGQSTGGKLSLSCLRNAVSASGSSVHDRQIHASGGTMNEDHDPDEMREYYDFSNGVRGKYAARYAQGVNLVRLDPDVAAVFPDEVAVNEALRALVAIVRRQAEAASMADQSSS